MKPWCLFLIIVFFTCLKMEFRFSLSPKGPQRHWSWAVYSSWVLLIALSENRNKIYFPFNDISKLPQKLWVYPLIDVGFMYVWSAQVFPYMILFQQLFIFFSPDYSLFFFWCLGFPKAGFYSRFYTFCIFFVLWTRSLVSFNNGYPCVFASSLVLYEQIEKEWKLQGFFQPKKKNLML